ncbi:methionine--tRNA ligase [Alkalibacter saccharofermentans]|uniref:Methionine--tRNA ligase n=1 Tax=Alkalibacter saccharofermentans DSM 14828 TaxID=1120975 RepID=A0A1M4T3J1_9FIRM|nr:methionine--tRNA ligase [Alkalibacter saccharofermentans]SHE39102.1 methionyl-tRNA synthetase [Alkalibacter saccharofermentans DSM 14828]
MKPSYYITTPIYYPSGKLHIGHTYTTVAADAMARYKKKTGYDVFFLTGTDEHGQKIEEKAKEEGVTPKEYVDEIVKGIKSLWELMDIDYDHFIRTTDPYHEESVRKIFKKLYDKGDIYKSHYEGWYCTPCEAFWTETQLEDEKCPDCGREVKQEREEAYFFKMSKYADRLIEHIEQNPHFIQPESRKNEMINNFLKPGLQDLCVSRTTFDWGVPVDFDPGHVVYVWIDALSNYITALGYLNDRPQLMEKFWPADVHLIGKDILRFHTIYWPIMLMALDLPLPKQVFGHGWILLKGGKMSKSKGNVIDPVELSQKYGVDSLRYFVLREMSFGADGVYNEDALVSRINSDLANDLGNLLSRTVAMVEKYFGGIIPSEKQVADIDQSLLEMISRTPKDVASHMEKMELSNALAIIWKLVSRANKYIDETTPWILGKDSEMKERLAGVMFNLAETLRVVSVLIEPFMPTTAKKMQAQINIPEEALTWESASEYGAYGFGEKMSKGDNLFPRVEAIEEKKEETKSQIKKSEQKKGKKEDDTISIDDFAKVKLKVAEVIQCDKHPDADRLLVLQVKIGEERRQIVSGIAQFYSAEDMIGKRVVVITNLKKTKIRGIESQGMILAAADKKDLNLITVDRDISDGTEVR